MSRLSVAIAILCLVAVGRAVARPVSYEGAWTVIQETDRQSTALWTHLTLNTKLSLGYRGEWDRRMDAVFQGGQATYLIKRWFGENYQANLYGMAGGGLAYGVNGNTAGTRPAAFGGLLADWETRRWFLSYRLRGVAGTSVDSTFIQAARFGVAPYIGDMGELHTWLMVEIDNRADLPDPIGITPLVRFFKGTALLELGWSVTDDQPLANFMYRF